MCGIAGIVSPQFDERPKREELLRMLSVLDHRGPDEAGIYLDARAGLGHTRLSIVDLAGGTQPLSNEDGSLWITFNGEFFNHVELRAELSALGHQFRTRSDTEVIVHAYEAWGTHAFERLNGQWALALWDAAKRRLLLARDRFGVHPLYLCRHAGMLYFASSVHSIFAADPTIPRALDPRGIDQTFTFWSVVPPQSVFQGIEELVPGSLCCYDDTGTRELSRGGPTFPDQPAKHFAGSLDDAATQVRAQLERATALRVTRADVPVASYLSGGLDSSLISALAARHTSLLRTFSLRFEDAEYDETVYQREMAQRLGSAHHELMIGRGDIARAFPSLIRHTERPVLRTAAAPLMLLSAFVHSQGIKVVLTGEGADEMFAGYDLFREAKIRRFWAKQPHSALRPRALDKLYPYLARSPVGQRAHARAFFGRDLANAGEPGFGHGLRWSTTSAVKRLFSKELRARLVDSDVTRELLGELPSAFGRWSPLAQDQHLEIVTLLSGYLLSCQGDRALMANSVEGRYPFLDPELVSFAESLPPAYKLRVLDEKHVLKRAARELVSPAVLRRAKQPYRAPDALAFTGRHADYAPELLSTRAVRDAGVFDPEAVGRLWRKCLASAQGSALSNTDNMALVGVLSTQLLHHQHIRSLAGTSRPSLRLTVDHRAL